jgi:hypothetical protein
VFSNFNEGYNFPSKINTAEVLEHYRQYNQN